MIPQDYTEKVYAGVLGKIIGVYLGRPIEGWSYERIMATLGETNYYVHEAVGTPLVVTDDDITGTFTFVRSLTDNGCTRDLTAAQIGVSWLNYLIENKTILWWGGLGASTEHTAFLRLKSGMKAPESGSIATNGRVVAEQIGAQIFIDGWGMVCPGDPELAAELARKAASVSHGGEAIYGAQVIAAMEAMAFVDPDVDALLDKATSLIPQDSTIYQLIADLRGWYVADGDWHTTVKRIQGKYGYDKYGGGCHMIPNHALIILGLLYGRDDFQRALMITNTAGWDTDCNVANIGCLMGIRLGLRSIDAGVDWRGPVADRLYMPTADAGRGISDAVRETYDLVNAGRKLQGEGALTPKAGARFHFSLPGSVQGFMSEDSPECRGAAVVSNVGGSLAVAYSGVGLGRKARVGTATFVPPSAIAMKGYELIASPTLYSGQTVLASISAEDTNTRDASVCLYVRVYGPDEKLAKITGGIRELSPGSDAELIWAIPDTNGQPIAEIGVEVGGRSGCGGVRLDWLTWAGAPSCTFAMPDGNGTMWKRAWADSTDWPAWWANNELPFDLIQNTGCGMKTIGESEWTGYTVSALVKPRLAEAAGLVANGRGLLRYAALLICRDGMARLVERCDGEQILLAQAPLAWGVDRPYALSLTTRDDGGLVGTVDGSIRLEGTVRTEAARGAAGLLLESGHCYFGPVTVVPAQ